MKRRDRRALATQVALEGFRRLREQRESELRAAASATGRVIIPDLDWAFRVVTAIGRGAAPERFFAELVDLGQVEARRDLTPLEVDLVVDGMWKTVLVAVEEIEARRAVDR